MSTAAQRLAAIDDLPATELCSRTEATLDALVWVMNEETTLLRAGHYKEAAAVTADKTRLAQEYVGLVRSVQRQSARLIKEAPVDVQRLRLGHEKLATQMAENLRVIATARNVTEDLLTDVAAQVSRASQAKTYGNTGTIAPPSNGVARGIAINRQL